jgi:hypothetical protein
MLPPISDVDKADELIGGFLSDLDDLHRRVNELTRTVPLEDLAFTEANGIQLDNRPVHIEPAAVARLLVFADEVIEDAAHIAEYAEKIRGGVLRLYRNHVIEGGLGA